MLYMIYTVYKVQSTQTHTKYDIEAVAVFRIHSIALNISSKLVVVVGFFLLFDSC